MFTKATFRRFSLLLSVAIALWGQAGQYLTVSAPGMTTAARKAPLAAKLAVQLVTGFHVVTPLRLTWSPSPLQVREIVYPKPQTRTYSFSKQPLSVYLGNFEIETRFAVPADAPLGAVVLTGKLRYQACNETTCFQPRSVDVRLPVNIRTQ
jgi:hypothetical protein